MMVAIRYRYMHTAWTYANTRVSIWRRPSMPTPESPECGPEPVTIVPVMSTTQSAAAAMSVHVCADVG